MRSQRIALAVAGALALFGSVLGSVPAASGGARLIYYGWGTPDTQALVTQRATLGRLPFDGSGVAVALDRDAWARGVTNTGNSAGWQVMGPRRFERSTFARAMVDLKGMRDAKWQVFLPIILCSDAARGVTWFDDDRWNVISENVATLAAVGASGGATGFIFDPEHYCQTKIFKGASAEDATSRDTTYAKARQRGREVCLAIRRHLPEPVIIALFGHSSAIKHRSREGAEYELLGPFLDGVIEAMSGNSILVDGFEYSYGFRQRPQFVSGAREIREFGERVTGNRDVFRRRVRGGFGLWIDYGQRLTHWSPSEFASAVADALEVSGSYVWIYAQTVRFFPPDSNAKAYGEAVRRVRAQRGL